MPTVLVARPYTGGPKASLGAAASSFGRRQPSGDLTNELFRGWLKRGFRLAHQWY